MPPSGLVAPRSGREDAERHQRRARVCALDPYHRNIRCIIEIRLKRTPISVGDRSLLRDHVTLQVDCMDRLYLNGYVPTLQRPQNL
jgi:hypothetical protein